MKELHAQKERLIEMDKHLKESEEIAQQQIKEWPHPFAKEIETCDHLSSYLHQMKRKAGLEVDEEVAAKEIQQKLIEEMNRENMEKRMADGKVEAHSRKEEMTIIGGGKKKDKKRKQRVEYEDIFSLDMVIVQKFGLINVSPPTQVPDLDKRLGEIAERKKWYLDNGEEKKLEQIKEY